MSGPLLEMTSQDASKANTTSSLSTTDHKAEKSFLVELKNGKVIFKQKPISFEKQSETLQEIVKFRDMLEQRIANKEPPLTSFPEEHRPVIAKLAHESDKTITSLSKYIHQELLPTVDEDDDTGAVIATQAALPVATVENAIKAVLIRNNYGIDVPLGLKHPAAICVWRWEVRDEYKSWLPKNSQEKAEVRQHERVQAKADLKTAFEALSQEERDIIVDPKAIKLPKENKLVPTNTVEGNTEESSPSKKQGKKKAEETENDAAENKEKLARSKKSVDPEKAAKEKERLEKKAARAEKEKKEQDAKSKSQSLMNRFFSKPSTSSKPKQLESAVAGPSNIQSEFDRVFKPFALPKDKVLAPQNWFLESQKRGQNVVVDLSTHDVVVIDSDDEKDTVMQDPPLSQEELARMSPRARLHDILSTLPTSATSLLRRSRPSRPPRPYKTFYPVSMRDVMNQLTEAEVAGNDDDVRALMKKLTNRDTFPAKVFIFHEDGRPGYFGTWTRSSRIIGPRRPLAKDTLVFDYAYDSGEEWEPEPVDAEDVAEDGEEEEDGDEPDSDADSWLVDDDDEVAPMFDLNSSPPPFPDLPLPPPKRKAELTDRNAGKKRKVVIPLVPFAKGPIWESRIGECNYEPFKPYNIQLFNDTPYSIDPFTFISHCLEDHKEHKVSLKAPIAPNPGPSDAIFAVPALPPRFVYMNEDISTTTSAGAPTPPKKASGPPKANFPDVYLPTLLHRITSLQASSITALVETIYQELKEYKVKKNAVEAKVREVSEKCKDKKVWIVKPALMSAPVS